MRQDYRSSRGKSFQSLLVTRKYLFDAVRGRLSQFVLIPDRFKERGKATRAVVWLPSIEEHSQTLFLFISTGKFIHFVICMSESRNTRTDHYMETDVSL